MKKTSIIASLATVLTLGAVAGTLVLAHGASAQPGWDGPNSGMWGKGMMMGRRDHGGMGPGLGTAGTGRDGMRLFEEFDRSGDGEISRADIEAVRSERLAAFDADGDGVLTLDEYEALWLDAMRPRMVRGFQRLDIDGDAAVTAAEFIAPYEGLVDRFDRDGDGMMTEAEVREQMNERRSAIRGRAGGPGMGPGRMAD